MEGWYSTLLPPSRRSILRQVQQETNQPCRQGFFALHTAIGGSWFKSSHILFQFSFLTVKSSQAHRWGVTFWTWLFFSHQFSSQWKRGDVPPLKLCIFHLSQIFTHKQRWYMGVKTIVSKIKSVFFSLSVPVYEVTLFLYLLRPRRTGGKNKN